MFSMNSVNSEAFRMNSDVFNLLNNGVSVTCPCFDKSKPGKPGVSLRGSGGPGGSQECLWRAQGPSMERPWRAQGPPEGARGSPPSIPKELKRKRRA